MVLWLISRHAYLLVQLPGSSYPSSSFSCFTLVVDVAIDTSSIHACVGGDVTHISALCNTPYVYLHVDCYVTKRRSSAIDSEKLWIKICCLFTKAETELLPSFSRECRYNVVAQCKMPSPINKATRLAGERLCKSTLVCAPSNSSTRRARRSKRFWQTTRFRRGRAPCQKNRLKPVLTGFTRSHNVPSGAW